MGVCIRLLNARDHRSSIITLYKKERVIQGEVVYCISRYILELCVGQSWNTGDDSNCIQRLGTVLLLYVREWSIFDGRERYPS